MKNSKRKMMRVLIVEPGNEPYVADILPGLDSLQHHVGGLIQAIYAFEDPKAAIIANDEGKLLGLPWNRPLLDEEGNIYDILVGTFLVVGLTENDFGSLSEEQITIYTDMFQRIW